MFLLEVFWELSMGVFKVLCSLWHGDTEKTQLASRGPLAKNPRITIIGSD